IHPAFKPLFGATAYLGDAAMIEKSKDNARAQLRTLFERIDAQLGKHDWIAGGTRSIADPYLHVVTRWARAQGIDLTGLANLERHFRQMEAAPGVQAALRQEGLASPTDDAPVPRRPAPSASGPAWSRPATSAAGRPRRSTTPCRG